MPTMGNAVCVIGICGPGGGGAAGFFLRIAGRILDSDGFFMVGILSRQRVAGMPLGMRPGSFRHRPGRKPSVCHGIHKGNPCGSLIRYYGTYLKFSDYSMPSSKSLNPSSSTICRPLVTGSLAVSRLCAWFSNQIILRRFAPTPLRLNRVGVPPQPPFSQIPDSLCGLRQSCRQKDSAYNRRPESIE